MVELHDKESEFHDHWAQTSELSNIRVAEFWTAPTAIENQFILSQLPLDLHGFKVLDIGAGLGESSIMFAKKGAEVTAIDLSPQMSEFSKKLAIHHGVEIETLTCPAESIPLEKAEWDIIYTANTIHHLGDKDSFLHKVRSLLKPGGIFISWDPVKYNPVIAIYRLMATQVRTEDESPLGVKDLGQIKSYFPNAKSSHFWLFAQSLFLKYFLINRIHPNQSRYWKKIYEETPESLGWWMPLKKLDDLLLKLPIVRWLSWNIVVIATKETA